MADEDRITIIAESFEAAALEFHRRNLASEGYRMAGPISMQRFELMNGPKRGICLWQPDVALPGRTKLKVATPHIRQVRLQSKGSQDCERRYMRLEQAKLAQLRGHLGRHCFAGICANKAVGWRVLCLKISPALKNPHP